MGLTNILAFAALAMGAGLHGAQGHAAHVHGSGQLAMAMDAGGQLQAEFEAPGDSVFGFEGPPRSGAQRETMAQAMTRLLDGANMLGFNGEAGCDFRGATSGDDGHHHAADDHHDDHAHSNVHIIYQFQCAHPGRLTRIETSLFAAFERLEEIDTVFLSPQGQQGFELTPTSPDHRIVQ